MFDKKKINKEEKKLFVRSKPLINRADFISFFSVKKNFFRLILSPARFDGVNF